jgi:hypothetical protein
VSYGREHSVFAPFFLQLIYFVVLCLADLVTTREAYMPDNPNVVALLKEYKDESSIKRPEVGRIIGMTIGQVAGIRHRNRLVPWPQPLPHVITNRGCQFPLGQPGTEEFRLCGIHRENDPLLCKEHKGKKWIPECSVLPLKK